MFIKFNLSSRVWCAIHLEIDNSTEFSLQFYFVECISQSHSYSHAWRNPCYLFYCLFLILIPADYWSFCGGRGNSVYKLCKIKWKKFSVQISYVIFISVFFLFINCLCFSSVAKESSAWSTALSFVPPFFACLLQQPQHNSIHFKSTLETHNSFYIPYCPYLLKLKVF